MEIKKRGVLLIRNSKSQITIFMVIALIIVMLGLVYFVYERTITDKEIEVVQPEAAPVKLYVDDCIQKVANDGLDLIGLSGGYINPPQNVRNDPSSYFSTFPEGGFKMPYWWHDGISAIPTQETVKQQLLGYMRAEFKNCIDNFKAFEERFEIAPLKDPLFDVSFNENDVYVTLEYPLEIVAKEGNFKTLIEKFAYTIPVRFKKVFELARTIMDRENKDYFLEERTIDLYSMDPQIPTTDIEATCKGKVWYLNDVKSKLQTLLRVNLPYIRIQGTNYDNNLLVPLPEGEGKFSDSYYSHHYIWQVDTEAEKKYKDLKVSFAYENWPMDLNARPSNKNTLRSNSQKGTNMLSFLCLHIWHFTYDIQYPTVVTITDPESETNRQYKFNFAFKVAIDHNYPRRFVETNISVEQFDEISEEEYCSDVKNEVTIFTANNATGEDLSDVNLTFVCGNYYCDIGPSKGLGFGAASGLTTRLPYCVNGVIKGKKQGFQDGQAFIQTDLDGVTQVLLLNPIKEFNNYKVVKHSFSNPLAMQELSSNEKATILIRGLNTGYETYSMYPRDVDFPLALPQKNEQYEVSILILDNENLVGGYLGNLSLTQAMVANSNEIIFHAIVSDSKSEDDTALMIAGLSSYSKKIPGPELK